MIHTLQNQSNTNLNTAKQTLAEISHQSCSSINHINTAVDITPYVHSSVFEVLQPSKNLQIKLCSIANLETIEDDVYQKLIKKEKNNHQKGSSQSRGLRNKELAANSRDFRSQKNIKYEQNVDNNHNKNVDLKSDKLYQQEQNQLNKQVKIRNFSQNNIDNAPSNDKKGILKQFQRQCSIMKMNKQEEEEDLLIQLNMYAKNNKSSLTHKNLQFLAVKKDQLENTLNYLDQLNKANEESQRNSMFVLEKDLGNKYTVKNFNKITPQQDKNLNVIKSFANLPDQQSKADLSSYTNFEQLKIFTSFGKQSDDKDGTLHNTLSIQQNGLNSANQSPLLVTSYHSRNQLTNQQVTSNLLSRRNLSIAFQSDNLTGQNTQENNKNLKQINGPVQTNLDEHKNTKQRENHNQKQNKRTSQVKIQISNQTGNLFLKNQQTISIEDMNELQLNPSTLDKIDQISNDQSHDQIKEKTEPLPKAISKNQAQIKSIRKQKTLSYKSQASNAKNISFLNLQEVNNYNRDPLSSRKTADTTPFNAKPTINIENHVQLLKAKAELISPISTNIQGSEDRKSTQNDSQFNSLIKKNENLNDTQSHNTSSEVRQISPFTINQNPHAKSQFREKHNMQIAKQKIDNQQNFRFESPPKDSNIGLLGSGQKESMPSQNQFLNTNSDLKNKKLNKLTSQEFGSQIKKLSINGQLNNNINEMDSQVMNQNQFLMNIPQLKSYANLQNAINTAVFSQTTANSLQKQIDFGSPLRLRDHQKPSSSTDGTESYQTPTTKVKKINEKNLEPKSLFIKNLYQGEYSDETGIPISIQELNNGDIFEGERYEEFEKNQNLIFNKFISQTPQIQGKVKCGLADFIKQNKNIEMNRLKTYYKFGFSAASKDEKSMKLQHVLEGIVPKNETGIQSSELWSEKHLKIIHDRVNFNQEKQFIQSYISYKQRNPANNYILHKKVNSLDQQQLLAIQKERAKKQFKRKDGCLTDRHKVEKVVDKINQSLEEQIQPNSSQNVSFSTKKQNTKSSSMTQSNFKQFLPSSIFSKNQLNKEFIRDQKLFKDLIQFTDKVIKSNKEEIKVYSNIKKFEDEE